MYFNIRKIKIHVILKYIFVYRINLKNIHLFTIQYRIVSLNHIYTKIHNIHFLDTLVFSYFIFMHTEFMLFTLHTTK